MGINNEKGEGNAEISFGTGNIAGDFFRDKMCIGDSLCIDSSFIAADKESTEPFQEIPFDGIMGLGFKDLSMGQGFNIVDDLYAKGQLPGGQISFYLTDDGDSEVTFGGYKSEYLASDIVWAPVKKESYWQVSVDDITFDNVPKGLCNGGCEVAVDTGTSMLAGPSDLVDKLSNMVAAKSDCSNYNGLPKLGFQIGDKVLNLKPDDYMDSAANDCSFSLMALDVPPPKGPLFIFGDPFLRRFVTIFDRSGPRVGFAVAKHSDDNTPAAELISRVGADASDAGSPPTGGLSPSAVNLHLDSGLMGPGDGDSSDDSASPPAPTPVAPSPPPPAWEPPSPPPANSEKSFDSSDPFGSSSAPVWPSSDDSQKAKVMTSSPADDTSSLWHPNSDYEKILLGPKDDSAPTSYDSVKALGDTAPVQSVAVKSDAPSSSPFSFDAPSAGSDNSWESAFGEPSTPTARPVPSIAKASSQSDDADQSTKAFDMWSLTKEFDTPSAEAAPEKTVAKESKPNDWSARWSGGLDSVDLGVDRVLGVPSSSVGDSTSKQSQDMPTTPKSITDDSISRMRWLFKKNALLQKQKQGHRHLVSVKLHRGH